MKKLIALLVLLVSISFSADYKPFTFSSVANDSASQQEQYDYMLQYKLFGYEYLMIGQNDTIPDKSGWNGSSKKIEMKHAVVLGGPILTPNTIDIGNGNQFITGPVRGSSFTMGNDNSSIFAGNWCFDNALDNQVQNIIARSNGKISCDSVPDAPVDLQMPMITFPDTTKIDIVVNDREKKFIDIPDVPSYDLYVNSIRTGTEDTLYFRLANRGTLTRVFVKDEIVLGNHTVLQTYYGDSAIAQDKYRGNLLFYTQKDFTLANSDNGQGKLQGTFISTSKIYFKSNIQFSGQLIANQLEVGDNFSGKNFHFVKFDPDTIDVKLDKYGGLRENDSTVIIPVELSDTASVAVFFTYCIDLKDGVTVEDFNPPKFPICGQDPSIEVAIPRGSKVPDVPIKVNVKIDTLEELNDYLVLHIDSINGAILPNGETSGELKIKIIDALPPKNTSVQLAKTDTIKTYQEELLIPPGLGYIGNIKYTDDGKDTLIWTFEDPSGLFDVKDGVITTNHVFDYETEDTVYVIKVKVIDGEFADSANYTIKITNIDEPITVTGKIEPVNENVELGTIVGAVIGKDADSADVTYTINTTSFKIDPITGVITTNTALDYETKSEYPVTVTVKSTDGSKKDTSFVIYVKDVNEPVHVQDTTCSVKENYTGKVCKIPATDDDGTKPKYFVTDTTNYAIDSTGQLTIKNPIDYEKKTKDTVKVIVTDGEFYDTATVIIRVLDEDEIPEIKTWDDEKPKDTIKTNEPDHKYEWQICEGDTCVGGTEYPHITKDTTIKVCNAKKTKCDSIVVLFNDAPPIVTLTNTKSTDALIDYITIEEQKDDKIYVNKKDNKLTVTVKDTVHKTEKSFPIDVKLDTTHISSKNVKDYSYLIDESLATYTSIGNGLIEVKEVVKDGDRKITLTKIVKAKTMEPIDTTQTVSYVVKQDGKELTISYLVDNLTGQRLTNYQVTYSIDSCTTVKYELNDDKKIAKNKEGNIAYTIKYEYTDDFGNKASSEVSVVYDDVPPKVEILSPDAMEHFNTNAITVKWTVNGEKQDTLTLQRLEKGINYIIRRYVDKAGNVAADTVTVLMKEAKDIAIKIVNPVTEVNQDKVDSFYNEGNKYNDKKPYTITTLKGDDKPDPVGIGFTIDIALPSVSPTGGLATLDDIVKNGVIPVDDKGNIVGASTKGIPVEEYVEKHCTDEFKKDYKKNGLNIPLYDVTYQLHLWIYTNTANYVNDFNVEYTLNDEDEVTSAGTVTMVLDWLTDRDGNVKAKNKHALGTSAYLTKLFSKSVAKHRCDYKEQKKGDKTVKKEEDFTTFGYKRPKK